MKILVTGLFLVIVAKLSHQAVNRSEPIYVLTNVKNVVVANKRLAHFSTMFDSVIRGAQRRPLHWLILTNTADVTTIHELVRKILAAKSQVPVKVEYINLERVAVHFAAQINLTRQYFTCREPLDTSDYFDEVFHLGAVYHRIFPFPRLIALDLDLQFQNVDIADLELQFDRMGPQSLMSIAYDQTPHYWYFFREFRQSQSSAEIQQPIRGLNTGVLLMNLERIRQSQVYNSYLDAANLEQLVDKYGLYGCIAYQDFFTFIFTEKPQLFTLLDCTWNRQLDTVYKHVVLSTDIFDAFHRCHGDVKIYHANGGSLLLDDQF